jgi:AraC-like DNA-binding protein
MRFFQIERDFQLLSTENKSGQNQMLTEPVSRNFIQFHFCLDGGLEFGFNQNSYSLGLAADKALLLYNPNQDLPISLQLKPRSSWISILISIEKFHGLFSDEAGFIDFLNEENRNRKYYQDSELSPAMVIVLREILKSQLHENVRDLYLKGKVYELMALFFDHPKEADIEQCPFLVDEENVRRIRKAKAIIIENLNNPPSLKELSEMIGLSLNKLKEGFKEIYGETVFGFLFNYKMELARQLLESGKHNVNEVGLKIGYSTGSHFIAAFKKKFGTTPKKYISSVG